MSHTRNLSAHGKSVGKMHYSSDFSGDVVLVDVDGHERAIPGIFVEALREVFMDDARDAAVDLCEALGLTVED